MGDSRPGNLPRAVSPRRPCERARRTSARPSAPGRSTAASGALRGAACREPHLLCRSAPRGPRTPHTPPWPRLRSAGGWLSPPPQPALCPARKALTVESPSGDKSLPCTTGPRPGQASVGRTQELLGVPCRAAVGLEGHTVRQRRGRGTAGHQRRRVGHGLGARSRMGPPPEARPSWQAASPHPGACVGPAAGSPLPPAGRAAHALLQPGLGRPEAPRRGPQEGGSCFAGWRTHVPAPCDFAGSFDAARRNWGRPLAETCPLRKCTARYRRPVPAWVYWGSASVL